MQSITVVENKFISVQYLPDKKIIYHVIHQPISGQPLRDALNAGTEALQRYGATKWLSDDRENGPLPLEDAEWGFAVWQPRTIKLGWKYWALVVPEAIEAAGSMVSIMENLYELGLRMRVFTDVEEALAWLDSFE
ncbi:MAG: hypothetical protein CUN51_02220 [Candidatus Thermofonsia Clade 1 bacterium]|uniref:STAS/SEC14 domain-containing protein n=1 Tax=Candidatus Thermofonsia Clade 1 bacterium TaxID=2364210 RepID=A0A2M8P2K9_9CHLR|nr:MAG: hypothetical protein CUN51_02220 [Candidatus Thermofonsia Clade 1 bacterium]